MQNKTSFTQRIICAVLALLMFVSILPISVFAQGLDNEKKPEIIVQEEKDTKAEKAKPDKKQEMPLPASGNRQRQDKQVEIEVVDEKETEKPQPKENKTPQPGETEKPKIEIQNDIKTELNELRKKFAPEVSKDMVKPEMDKLNKGSLSGIVDNHNMMMKASSNNGNTNDIEGHILDGRIVLTDIQDLSGIEKFNNIIKEIEYGSIDHYLKKPLFIPMNKESISKLTNIEIANIEKGKDGDRFDANLLTNSFGTLKKLDIDTSYTDNIHVFKNANNLKDLWIRESDRNLEEPDNFKQNILDVFAGFNNLDKLTITVGVKRNLKLSDIDVLKNSTSMTSFVNSSNIMDENINSITHLTNLKKLTLENMRKSFSNDYNPEVPGFGIRDISGIEKLQKLEDLNLTSNSISDIKILSKLSNLKSLNVSNNNIRDFRPLSKISSLNKWSTDIDKQILFVECSADGRFKLDDLYTINGERVDISKHLYFENEPLLPRNNRIEKYIKETNTPFEYKYVGNRDAFYNTHQNSFVVKLKEDNITYSWLIHLIPDQKYTSISAHKQNDLGQFTPDLMESEFTIYQEDGSPLKEVQEDVFNQFMSVMRPTINYNAKTNNYWMYSKNGRIALPYHNGVVTIPSLSSDPIKIGKDPEVAHNLAAYNDWENIRRYNIKFKSGGLHTLTDGQGFENNIRDQAQTGVGSVNVTVEQKSDGYYYATVHLKDIQYDMNIISQNNYLQEAIQRFKIGGEQALMAYLNEVISQNYTMNSSDTFKSEHYSAFLGVRDAINRIKSGQAEKEDLGTDERINLYAITLVENKDIKKKLEQDPNYEPEEKLIGTVSPNEIGDFIFKNLTQGAKYKIVETKVPYGYIPQEESITVDSNTKETVTFTNIRKDASYEVRYLEKGTDQVLHQPKTGQGKYLDKITEHAIDISNYDLVDENTKVVKLVDVDNPNVITFYYERHQPDRRTLIVNYLIEGTDFKVPGINPNPYINREVKMGSTVTIDHPDAGTFKVIPNQPTSVTIGEEKETVVNIYYNQDKGIIPKEMDYEIHYLIEGTNRPVLDTNGQPIPPTTGQFLKDIQVPINKEIGEYTLSELQEKYVQNGHVTVKKTDVNSETGKAVYKVYYRPKTGAFKNITIKKVDEKGQPMANVQFGLYRKLGDVELEMAYTDEKGQVVFKGISEDVYIKELKTLEGYRLPKDKKVIKINEFDESKPIQIVNYPISNRYPVTGGLAMAPYLAVMAIGIAGSVLFIRKRNK